MAVNTNVRRALALSVLGALASGFMFAQSPAALNEKYRKPARITQLDWLLLTAEVESFTNPVRWDDYHLINSVSLYSAPPSRALVGMTFVVNKESYIALSDDIAKKVFADVVIGACGVLENTIPEVGKGANVYANFVVIGGGIVADYKNGTVSLRK